MEVLNNRQLDEVSGGILWGPWLGGITVFIYLNLEKIRESWNGLSDGFDAGFNGTSGDVGAVCPN